MGCPDALHMLSHRTDVIITVSIVMKGLHRERIRFIVHALLAVKPIVFDVGLYSRLFHEPVIFL